MALQELGQFKSEFNLPGFTFEEFAKQFFGGGGGSGLLPPSKFTPKGGEFSIFGIDPEIEGGGGGSVGGGGGGGFGGGVEFPTGLSEELSGSLTEALTGLLSGAVPEGILLDAENILTEVSKQRELNRVSQNAELFNSRGLLESGPRFEEQHRIQESESTALLQALANLRLQGLGLTLEGQKAGIGGTLGFGGLGLQGNNQAFNQALAEAYLNIALAQLQQPQAAPTSTGPDLTEIIKQLFGGGLFGTQFEFGQPEF